MPPLPLQPGKKHSLGFYLAVEVALDEEREMEEQAEDRFGGKAPDVQIRKARGKRRRDEVARFGPEHRPAGSATSRTALAHR